MGAYNGNGFIWEEENEHHEGPFGSWWRFAKLVWRYGPSASRARSRARAATDRFRRFATGTIVRNPREKVRFLGLEGETSSPAISLLNKKKEGITAPFIDQIIRPFTRGNFRSDLDSPDVEEAALTELLRARSRSQSPRGHPHRTTDAPRTGCIQHHASPHGIQPRRRRFHTERTRLPHRVGRVFTRRLPHQTL